MLVLPSEIIAMIIDIMFQDVTQWRKYKLVCKDWYNHVRDIQWRTAEIIQRWYRYRRIRIDTWPLTKNALIRQYIIHYPEEHIDGMTRCFHRFFPCATLTEKINVNPNYEFQRGDLKMALMNAPTADEILSVGW